MLCFVYDFLLRIGYFEKLDLFVDLDDFCDFYGMVFRLEKINGD